jgi:hypothetical protein
VIDLVRADPPSDALRAAFGAEPGALVRVRSGAPAVERWYVAVALGGQGRYAAAAAVLEPLLVRPGVPIAVAAHAAVTLASHRRQLGGHAAARRYDALGLRLACSVPGDDGTSAADPHGSGLLAARVDALVGLAADAVGTAAPDTAQRMLDAAQRALAATAQDADGARLSWRPSVRLEWVQAELALARGHAAAAVGPARRALELARGGGSERHVVKSRIVLAVAAAAAGGDLVAAVGELDAAAAEALRQEMLPLVWPARLAAADLLGRIPGTARNANDGTVSMSQKSVSGQVSDAARRRHAAIATLSVIERRCHPVGRRLVGVATGVAAQPPVM